MQMALALHQWADLAQTVIGASAALAVVVAVVQIRAARSTARRERVYAYQDQFNELEFRRRSVQYREYWETHSYQDYKDGLTRLERNEMLMIPNLMEEVAALYNRKLLDRDVAAETLGVYVEGLWSSSRHYIMGLRSQHGPKLFCEWDEMQQNTPARKLKVDRRLARRRNWRKLMRGA